MIKNKYLVWIIFTFLTLVWGSSFILIKKSLVAFTPYQVGSLRVLIAAVVLASFGWDRLRKITSKEFKIILISGMFGNFLPAFMFAIAETEIDSSIVGILNSLTPLLTIILGVLFFGFKFNTSNYLGVFLGLVGAVTLIFLAKSINPSGNIYYAGFVLLATVFYGVNVNLKKKYLVHLPPFTLAQAVFLTYSIPALVVLYFSNFFSQWQGNTQQWTAMGYLCILSIVGTAVAITLLNRLIQLASSVFATSVTYTISVVAVLWGVLDGETFTFFQGIATAVLIFGVYLVNKKK